MPALSWTCPSCQKRNFKKFCGRCGAAQPIAPPKPKDFFKTPILRWQALWMIAGLLIGSVLIAIAAILTFGADQSAFPTTYAIESLIYLAPLAWLSYQIRAGKLNFAKLMGKASFPPHWAQYLALTLCAMAFTIGSSWLAGLALHTSSPDLAKRLFSEGEDLGLNPGIGMDTWWNILRLMVLAGLVPVVEEIFFRGILLHRISQKWGWKPGILVSSLVFGLLHSNRLGFFIFALLMTLIYLKAKSLWAPIFCHSFNNVLAAGHAWVLGPSAKAWDFEMTIQFYREYVWLGLCLFLVPIPFLNHFISRQWPSKKPRLPYG